MIVEYGRHSSGKFCITRLSHDSDAPFDSDARATLQIDCGLETSRVVRRKWLISRCVASLAHLSLLFLAG